MNEHIKIQRYVQPRLAWINQQLERTNLSANQRRVLLKEKRRKLGEAVAYYREVLDSYPKDDDGNPIEDDGRETRLAKPLGCAPYTKATPECTS